MNIHEKMIQWEKSIGVKLFEKMKIPQNAKVIDFGCGYGEYSVALSQHLKNGIIYAIDIDKNAIKAIKKEFDDYSIKNINIIQNNNGLIEFKNDFADIILLYDMIHGNNLKTKMPVRFKLYEEAYRVLKNQGTLSIAPFGECNNLSDKNGKYKKYTKEKIFDEIADYGFCFSFEIDGAIHFEKYRSPYQWKKFNNDMKFEDVEKGPIWNFIKK
jgi:ubiquinone/menaquinone biosynthesis C-methylase UbiE